MVIDRSVHRQRSGSSTRVSGTRVFIGGSILSSPSTSRIGFPRCRQEVLWSWQQALLWSGLPYFAMLEYNGESIAASAGWTSLGAATLSCRIQAVHLMVVSSTIEDPWPRFTDLKSQLRIHGAGFPAWRRTVPWRIYGHTSGLDESDTEALEALRSVVRTSTVLV